jgi:Zn-dependent protease with chaperone function
MAVQGRYFLPHSARFVPARAVAVARSGLRIEASDGSLLAQMPIRRVRVSTRLGTLARRFEFRDGGRFETDDNDGADALLHELRAVRGGGFVHRIERSFRWVAFSVAIAALCAYAFVVYGIPACALALAQATPRAVVTTISDQALQAMDEMELGRSGLGDADKAKARALFARVAAFGTGRPGAYRLLFRKGNTVGPNAFALPDGRVVMTDELWRQVKNDDEIEGVFAHEMTHVDRAHGLQQIYQASLVPAAIAFITGDASQFSQVGAVLPGVLLQSAYDRGFEQEADDKAAAVLMKLGGKPSHLADLLERLDGAMCKKQACPPSWLGTHPDTASRAARLRAGERGKLSSS